MSKSRESTGAGLSAAAAQVDGLPRTAGAALTEGLEVHQLTKTYVSGEREIRVLDRLSLSMGPGQNAAIVGPSGCGKSTFLYVLGTLETPTSGSVEIAGCRPFELNAEALAAFRNRTIGFVFQDHHLLPQLSVRENVLLPALALGSISDDQAARAEQLIERVGLSQRLNQRPGQLSGGERQRAAVARALLLRPRLILADEPTGSLDEANSDKISQLLLEMQAESGSMLLCVTHNPNLANRFQQTLTLRHGRFSEDAGASETGG
jgi:lipoprotein-releasing system ATP-binding protein